MVILALRKLREYCPVPPPVPDGTLTFFRIALDAINKILKLQLFT
jgi:hypothetical protein